MPRFFLLFRSGDQTIGQEDGFDLPDLTAARDEAIKAAREAVAQRIIADQVIDGEFFEIRSEDGRLLDRVTLKDVIRVDEHLG